MHPHDDDDMDYGNLEEKTLESMVLLRLEACVNLMEYGEKT